MISDCSHTTRLLCAILLKLFIPLYLPSQTGDVYMLGCFLHMLTYFWLVLTKIISFSSLSLFQSWFLWQDVCSNQQVEFFLYNLKPWAKKNRETTCDRIITTVLQPAHRPALTVLLTWYETSTGNVTAAWHFLWNSGLFHAVRGRTQFEQRLREGGGMNRWAKRMEG